MLIKIAMYNEKNQENDISRCCEENDSLFIPFEKNIFGILDKNPGRISFSRESANDRDGITNKTFVDIYQCLLNIKKRSSFFNRDKSPFEGLILDNQFFFNLIRHCIDKSIKINYISYNSNLESDVIIEDPDSIQELIKEADTDASIKIVRVSIQMNSREILFNKMGYVDIASSDITFFNNTKTPLINLLIKGLEG